MKIKTLLILLILLFTFTNLHATSYNTPVVDGAITVGPADWDADEHMGTVDPPGPSVYDHYMTWDANYIYFGFTGLNWSGNANDQIYGHFDVIAGGTTTPVNNASVSLAFMADFAYELIQDSGVDKTRWYQYDNVAGNWGTPVDFVATDFVSTASDPYHTEFRIPWSVFSASYATSPTPFSGSSFQQLNNETVNAFPPGAEDCLPAVTIGGFTFSEPLTDVSPGAVDPVLCEFEDQPLAVELTYFTVEPSLTGTLLEWGTESEVDNLGFMIERKTADTDWQEIVSYKTDNSLRGQGTVSYPTDYEYIDALVQQGNSYEYRLADVDYNGVVTYHATREVTFNNAPLSAKVETFTATAYPNPFNPTTTIRYSVPVNDTAVSVAIYDVSGNLVTNLVNRTQTAGWHEAQWNGVNRFGKEVPGGVYLSRVTVANQAKTSKLIFLK